jgi:hypothetical protein
MRGIILRRVNGVWRGWSPVVHSCSLDVPIPVGDTANAATAAAFRQRAKRECGRPPRDTLNAAAVFSIDTLEVHSLTKRDDIGSAWNGAVKAGVLELPPRIKRTWILFDGFTYVVELRRGNSYRASVIEHVEKPEVDADRQVQEVYRALAPLLSASTRRPE